MAGPLSSFLLKSTLAFALSSFGRTEFGNATFHHQLFEVEINQANLVNTSNSFGLRIYKEHLASDPSVGNVIFSPFSLASALYMLLEGTGGKTYSEIKRALGRDARQSLTIRQIERGMRKLAQQLPLQSEGYSLNVANSMWVKKGFQLEPKFKNKLIKIFGAETADVDFATNAMDMINEWCDRATNHTIPQLFDQPLDPNTIMVLINAIYFKGVWKTQFDPSLTYPRRFYPNKDTKWQTAPKVSTMSVVNEFNISVNEELGFQLVALPYENDEVVMYVLLPNETVTLETVESQLTYTVLKETIENSKQVKLDLALPKFKLSNELSLIPALNRVGVSQVFGDLANLSKMNQRSPLKVNKVIQKAVVEVNEQGTVAAAVSGISIMARSMKNRLDEFHADRPFAFYIQHSRSELILFAGRVTNPTF